MRPEGLEPPTLSGQDPKSCASASFATAANLIKEKNEITRGGFLNPSRHRLIFIDFSIEISAILAPFEFFIESQDVLFYWKKVRPEGLGASASLRSATRAANMTEVIFAGSAHFKSFSTRCDCRRGLSLSPHDIVLFYWKKVRPEGLEPSTQ